MCRARRFRTDRAWRYDIAGDPLVPLFATASTTIGFDQCSPGNRSLTNTKLSASQNEMAPSQFGDAITRESHARFGGLRIINPTIHITAAK